MVSGEDSDDVSDEPSDEACSEESTQSWGGRWEVGLGSAGEGDADKAVEHATNRLEGTRLDRGRLQVAEVTRENVVAA